jgi:putative flippase GtrA
MNNMKLNKAFYSEKSRATIEQFFYYCCIGICVNSLNYLLYLFATAHQVSPKVSMSVLYLAGVIVNILANRKWTFQSEGKLLSVALRAGVAYLLGYFIDFCLLYCFVDVLGYSHQLIQLLAIVVVAVFLFVSFKFYVFKRNYHPCRT